MNEKDQTKKEKKICGAKTKSGAPCQTVPMANGRCRLHGGKSLKGMASGRFKTGKYSKYLPIKARTKYLVAKEDKELLSLREEIALQIAYICELLSKLKSIESPEYYKNVIKKNRELQDAIDKQDSSAIEQVIQDLRSLICYPNDPNKIWKEIFRIMELKRRLAMEETKRLSMLKQFIPAEEVYTLVITISNIIKAHVLDLEIRRAIIDDIQKLIDIDPND